MKLYTKIVILSISLLVLSGSIIYYFTFSKLEELLIGSSISSELLNEVQTRTLIVSLVVLIASIGLAFFFSKVIVRPFLLLTSAAKAFSRGKANFELPTDGNDEVSVLGRELKKSAVTLNKRISEQQLLFQKLEHQKNKMQRQKELLEDSNLQIKESISYAKRIQRSLLPDASVLKKPLKDAMVFYRPKDIVSGDFYWFERVRKGRSDYLVIVCADATGHGVPGAIMSIMGSNQLTNIVYYQNYLDTKKILARLDKAIKFELYREEHDSTKLEGMEIGICAINLDDYTLDYSGIGIPLYLVRNEELIVYKPIRDMAGGMNGEEREVENRINKDTIELKTGDRIYMSSDGFQDQFGGPRDKKFMAKRLRDVLLEMKDIPMDQQAERLQQIFKEWKGNRAQTDDVVVLGAEF